MLLAVLVLAPMPALHMAAWEATHFLAAAVRQDAEMPAQHSAALMGSRMALAEVVRGQTVGPQTVVLVLPELY
tara:strand:- start:30 stop:248 length:219 start_codon:yes stop_codon:yes gene_type:complete